MHVSSSSFSSLSSTENSNAQSPTTQSKKKSAVTTNVGRVRQFFQKHKNMGNFSPSEEKVSVLTTELLIPSELLGNQKIKKKGINRRNRGFGNKAIKNLISFSFLNLPLEIQFHIYSFLPLTEMIRQREINRQISTSIDLYFAQLKGQFTCLRYLRETYTKNKNEKIKTTLCICLTTILSHRNLENFLKNSPIHREEFFIYFTSEERLCINWNQLKPHILEGIINIFFQYATDRELTIFIKNDIFAFLKTWWGYNALSYKNFAHLFFKELTEEREARLINLSIEQHLLEAMACTESYRYTRLLARLYEHNPESDSWKEIRLSTATVLKPLHPLLPFLCLLDIKILFKQFANDPSLLPIKLRDLFQKFKDLPYIFESEKFAQYFLTYAKSLNVQQLQAFIQGIENAISERFHASNAFKFMNNILDIASRNVSNHHSLHQVILPLLKEFISCHAHSRKGYYLKELLAKMTTKEQIQTFIEVVNTCSEPWRTLYLRLLIPSNPEESERMNISFKDREEAFAAHQLNIQHYLPIKEKTYYNAYHYAREYFKDLQTLDSESKFIKFFNKHYKGKKYQLQPLAAGLILSKKLILKTSLDSLTLKKNFARQGLIFKFFNQPLSIDDFLEAYVNKI